MYDPCTQFSARTNPAPLTSSPSTSHILLLLLSASPDFCILSPSPYKSPYLEPCIYLNPQLLSYSTSAPRISSRANSPSVMKKPARVPASEDKKRKKFSQHQKNGHGMKTEPIFCSWKSTLLVQCPPPWLRKKKPHFANPLCQPPPRGAIFIFEFTCFFGVKN